jgi:hypothetical protein
MRCNTDGALRIEDEWEKFYRGDDSSVGIFSLFGRTSIFDLVCRSQVGVVAGIGGLCYRLGTSPERCPSRG